MIRAAVFNLSKAHTFLEKVEPEKYLFNKDFDTYNSYLTKEDKLRMLASRILLDNLLKKFFNQKYSVSKLQKNEKGKPFIHGLRGLSISHSGDYAVVSISENTGVGIDIQKVGNFPEKDIHSILNQDEKLVYQSITDEDKQQWFFNLWSKKEAFLKAIGEGLAIEMKEITLMEDKNEIIFRNNKWYFAEIPNIENYTLQFCKADKYAKINWYNWEQNHLTYISQLE